MIRRAIEILSRPLRRRRWGARREFIIRWRNGTLDEDICCGAVPEVPCNWEERDPDDVKQDVHRWVEKKLEPWRKARTRADEFLVRAKKDLKKKKYVPPPPAGTLPDSFVPLSEEEDEWIVVGSEQERLSFIMEYYARYYRWNPLAQDDHICFHGTGPPAELFWKEQRRAEAIAFYKKALEEGHRDSESH